MYRPLPSIIAEFGIDEIYTIDAEFRPTDPNGYRQHGLSPHVLPRTFEPVCISAKRWTTQKISSSWYAPGDKCPWIFDDCALVVCYQGAAEMAFFAAAGWQMPTHILDLYPEYRRTTNGEFDAYGRRIGGDDHRSTDGRTRYGLLAAVLRYGLGSRAGVEKQSMIRRILAGPPYSEEDQREILDYNCGDVEDTECLFAAMLVKGDIANFGQALMRGDAARGFALRDLNGLPVDCLMVERLTRHWHAIRAEVVRRIEQRRRYGVFRIDSGGSVHFDQKNAAALVYRLGMQELWPRTSEGKFSFGDPDNGPKHEKSLKLMATINPYLEDLRQAKRLIDRTTVMNFPIGADGRCHGRYFPWAQVTGRSSPGHGSIFAMSKWARLLIKPGPGRALACVDLKSAEFGIAAALSHDAVMMEDYRAMLDCTIECVYFELAKWASQVPAHAPVKDHKAVRNRWKTACLAMMYGQSPDNLALATRISPSEARIIQSTFKQRYSTYWAWVAREIVHAHARGSIETVCGWKMAVNDRTEDRTLLNFHCQATCGDVMRRAIALMADRGIAICEIVHDAVVVEDAIESLPNTIEATKDCWREASLDVLGFELDADATLCRYPNRYEETDGEPMWRMLTGLLEQVAKNEEASNEGGPKEA